MIQGVLAGTVAGVDPDLAGDDEEHVTARVALAAQ